MGCFGFIFVLILIALVFYGGMSIEWAILMCLLFLLVIREE